MTFSYAIEQVAFLLLLERSMVYLVVVGLVVVTKIRVLNVEILK